MLGRLSAAIAEPVAAVAAKSRVVSLVFMCFGCREKCAFFVRAAAFSQPCANAFRDANSLCKISGRHENTWSVRLGIVRLGPYAWIDVEHVCNGWKNEFGRKGDAMSRLSLRLALAFLAFVVAGSLALVFWMASEERRQSRELFAAMAKANADFVKTGAPLTERTELSLSEVLGVDVFFVQGDRFNRSPGFFGGRVASLAAHSPGAVVTLDEREGVAVPVSGEMNLVLMRPLPEIRALSNGRTYVVLGAFWLISLALAAVLARGIVGPLRALAKRLPRIGEGGDDSLPEATRTDEIGELARAYQSTRKQLADERRAREEAERLATLGRMATGLAHEINNPVSAIKLHAQLLESDAPSESIAAILTENAKIEALVNQWMFLARPQPPAVAPCDLADVVAECIRSIAPAAEHSKVRIVSDVKSAVVSADRRRVSQAVFNVAMNAIHAMAAGGELRISTELARAEVVLVFRDTGPGFSEAALARATELFFSEKEGGMGIGLNVTAEILKAHGGQLRIANDARGAVVKLVFPAKEDA
jgi:signal transduction histidine kinase